MLGAVGQAWSGGPAEARWRGAMGMGDKVTLESIHDGTSRTIMYAESIGEIRHGQRVAAQSWIWGWGARACGIFDYDKPTHDTYPDIQMLGDSQYSSGVGFGSRHKDLVMATCDGATHAVHRDIDWTTLYEIAGMQDGGSPL